MTLRNFLVLTIVFVGIATLPLCGTRKAFSQGQPHLLATEDANALAVEVFHTLPTCLSNEDRSKLYPSAVTVAETAQGITVDQETIPDGDQRDQSNQGVPISQFPESVQADLLALLSHGRADYEGVYNEPCDLDFSNPDTVRVHLSSNVDDEGHPAGYITFSTVNADGTSGGIGINLQEDQVQQ